MAVGLRALNRVARPRPWIASAFAIRPCARSAGGAATREPSVATSPVARSRPPQRLPRPCASAPAPGRRDLFDLTPTDEQQCCATRSASSRLSGSGPPLRPPTMRRDGARDAGTGRRARADDGRRPRAARRRGRRPLRDDLGADAEAIARGDMESPSMPRSGRRLDSDRAVGRCRPAGEDLPPFVSDDVPAASLALMEPRPLADPMARRGDHLKARTAATCSTASSRSSRAPPTRSCS